jgi:hypothetical protein
MKIEDLTEGERAAYERDGFVMRQSNPQPNIVVAAWIQKLPLHPLTYEEWRDREHSTG